MSSPYGPNDIQKCRSRGTKSTEDSPINSPVADASEIDRNASSVGVSPNPKPN